MFNHQGRRPWACVNFVTAHDGFTLNDLVSYNEKHNEANGENNKDGSIRQPLLELRRRRRHRRSGRSSRCAQRQMRNMLATLLLSQGTPMMLAGDEFGRTQQGNNNAYCQDNEISWLDWDLSAEGSSRCSRFVRSADASCGTNIRSCAAIGSSPATIDEELEVKDVTWINASGEEMQRADWNDPVMRCFGMLIDGRAHPTGVRQRGTEATLLIVMNSLSRLRGITLPVPSGGGTWKLVLDTNLIEQVEGYEGIAGDRYGVTARSLVLFALSASEVH